MNPQLEIAPLIRHATPQNGEEIFSEISYFETLSPISERLDEMIANLASDHTDELLSSKKMIGHPISELTGRFFGRAIGLTEWDLDRLMANQKYNPEVIEHGLIGENSLQICFALTMGALKIDEPKPLIVDIYPADQILYGFEVYVNQYLPREFRTARLETSKLAHYYPQPFEKYFTWREFVLERIDQIKQNSNE